MWIGTDDGLYHDGAHVPDLGTQSIKHLTRQADVVYAATDHELWRYTRQWDVLARLPDEVRARWIVPVDGECYVGTSGADVYRLSGGKLDRDENFANIATRPAWHTPWGGPPSIWSACANGDDIWVNVHVGGIVHSLDAGASWTQTPLPIETDVHQVARTAEGDLLIASARGYAQSSDGVEWTFANDGLHGHYLRAVASTASAVFVAASHGPRSDAVAVYRRPKDAATFERSAPADDWLAENIDAPALASDGHTIAFGARDGRVFASANEGDDWTVVAADLPPVRSVLV